MSVTIEEASETSHGERGPPRVEIVVASTVRVCRSAELRRAIQSVLTQENVRPSVLLIANGAQQDPGLLAELSSTEGVTVIQQKEGDLPKALRNGRESVSAGIFGFLDDDDELMPRALEVRVARMRDDESVDVVVTNGYREEADETRKLHESMATYEADPLGSLISTNWLASCGAIFKTHTVPPDIWDGSTRYLEWTAVAFRLAHSNKHIRFIENKTFIIHESEQSLSKEIEYLVVAPHVVEGFLEYNMPTQLRRRFHRRMIKFRHQAARALVADGDYARAWRYHLYSMGSIYGFVRHIKFTVRLIGTMVYDKTNGGVGGSREK